ncbi:uncharacterized protein M6B38_180205 [Iris pallida]|uniref:AB hydrolase-1 domain-containing protein n=1 Tax=Iris pallida TaxID=29817 RepID=A0AAX6EP18_IRIPA|nr:uncharacterized protein M6B38_180205 [Iris pallida]
MGLISLTEFLLRRSFLSAGLHPLLLPIDSDTTVHSYVSKPLLPANPNPNPNSKKPVLVLLHGFGPVSFWQWHSQVRPLSRHFHLVVPDLLFFGRSTSLSPDRSELFQAHSISRFLDLLLPPGADGAPRPVYVAGTSYGGFVAYHVARLMGPGRVARAVIASSNVGMGDEDDAAVSERAGVEGVERVMLPSTAAEMRKLVGLAVCRKPRFIPDFLLRDAVKHLYKDNLEEKKQLIKGISSRNKDEFRLTPLPQDVLIIWGDHDRIFPLEKAFELQKHLGEKARLDILKNTGHLPHLEDPESFNKVLLNFLLETPKSSG